VVAAVSFLALARRLRDSGADYTAPGTLDGAPIVETREQIGAVLIRSPRFGEVWMVLEPSIAPEIVAEESGRAEPRPVLLAKDVARLRGKSDEMIRATLAVLATFPDARLIQ
jgi:hypothetical protein